MYDTFVGAGTTRSLISLLLLGLLAQGIYGLARKLIVYRVSSLSHTPRNPSSDIQQFESDFGRRHGCQLPPKLPKRWPLGIDRIKELWDSNSKGHLLEFLCSIACHYEPRNNLCQYLLFGPRAFHVLHPKNLEVVLSKRFQFGVEVLELSRYESETGERAYHFEPFLEDIVGEPASPERVAPTTILDPDEIDTIVVPAKDEVVHGPHTVPT